MSGLEAFVAMFFGLAVMATVFAAWVAGIVWAYRDARNRRRPAWAIALLVAAPPIWPLGLLLWYCFRPPFPIYTQPERRGVDDLGYPTAG